MLFSLATLKNRICALTTVCLPMVAGCNEEAWKEIQQLAHLLPELNERNDTMHENTPTQPDDAGRPDIVTPIPYASDPDLDFNLPTEQNKNDTYLVGVDSKNGIALCWTSEISKTIAPILAQANRERQERSNPSIVPIQPTDHLPLAHPSPELKHTLQTTTDLADGARSNRSHILTKKQKLEGIAQVLEEHHPSSRQHYKPKQPKHSQLD